MLTNFEYNYLWQKHFAAIVKPAINQNGCPADYCNYLNREHMFQDYLDIFRGFNSRGNTGIRPFLPCNNCWYYEHPFFDVNNLPLLKNKPSIKYLLLGEAAPTVKVASKHSSNCLIGHADSNNAYFYNILHTKHTGYYSAPLAAFNIGAALDCPENKLAGLLKLAEAGVVLIDLFPFSINYNDIRAVLNDTGITINYWMGSTNPATVINKLKYISTLKNNSTAAISIALIAPPKISHYIADKLQSSKLTLPAGYTIRSIKNYFTPVSNMITNSKKYFINWGNNSLLLNGIFANDTSMNLCPIYRCCGYSGSGTVPHELFIRNALL